MPPLPLSGRDLTIDNVIEVARGRRAVELEPGAARRMADSRSVIERLVADGATVYGVPPVSATSPTSGSTIADGRLEQPRPSHAAGVGDPLPDGWAGQPCCAPTRSQSGFRRSVRCRAAVGMTSCSHQVRALALQPGGIGELAPWRTWRSSSSAGRGRRSTGRTGRGGDALARASLTPLTLRKEGLPVNGTVMAASAPGAPTHCAAITADVSGAWH